MCSSSKLLLLALPVISGWPHNSASELSQQLLCKRPRMQFGILQPTASPVCLPSPGTRSRRRCNGAQALKLSPHKHHLNVQCAVSAPVSIINDGAAAVVTQGLQVTFGSGDNTRQVLKGVNLQIQRGSLHMLLGPNGCGKSTLLKVLGGLVPAAGGKVYIDAPTGFVFQNPDHQVVMPTVAADVAFGLGRYDLEEAQVAQAVRAALELVNMGHAVQWPTHTLSGGQRQRVAIAGALAENPRVLLLDELTTFLDVEDQFGVLQAIKDITRRHSLNNQQQSTTSTASNGPAAEQTSKRKPLTRVYDSASSHPGLQSDEPVTAIWVTHRFEELEYADSASYMHDGRVVFTGTADDMREYLTRLGAPGV